MVGTIHYDGMKGTDKGTILYFKPTLTGDEPPDLRQYQARNQAFPHESTGDQFYDEAQWESYRRLGEHVANVVLRFFRGAARQYTNPVEKLFLGASTHWHPAPPRQEEVFLDLSQRCAELESQVRENAPLSLRHEFFPEVAAAGYPPAEPDQEHDETQVLYFVIVAAQIMEDVWLAAQLETYWSHPLNQGWMAYFERWASTPSFRRWWTVARPLYNSSFADFVKERFNIRVRDVVARNEINGPGAHLTLSDTSVPLEAAKDGMAWQQWLARYEEPDLTIQSQNGPSSERKQVLSYTLKLKEAKIAGQVTGNKGIQVGFLLFQEEGFESSDEKAKAVRWKTTELFVPATLIGAGISARFLDALIKHFENLKVPNPPAGKDAFKYQRIIVQLEESRESRAAIKTQNEKKTTAQTGNPTGGNGEETQKARSGFRPDPASRNELVRTINFYKSRGFMYDSPTKDGQLRTLSLDLDTLEDRKKQREEARQQVRKDSLSQAL